MQTRDQNSYQAFSSVRATLTAHETDNTWKKVPALVKAVDDFDAVIAGIGTHLEITTLPSGAASVKKALGLELAQAAHEVAAAIHAYATEAGDDELAAEVDLSVTDIAQGRPASVIARCTNIVSLATENLDSLSDCNITQAKLTALTKKIDGFDKAALKPRNGVAKKAAANQALKRLMTQGRNILNRRIDKLMVQFRTSAPEFYAEYKTARKIVNSPAPHNDKKAAPEQPKSATATNGTAVNGTTTEAKVTETPSQNGHMEPAPAKAEEVMRSA